MRPQSPTPNDRRRAAIALAVIAIATWLDRDGCVVANQSVIFAFVVEALVVAGEAIQTAAAYIAVHLEAVVLWILSQLSWLSGHVAKILSSTGAMFSRVWDGMRAFYEDVLKPLALELKDFYDRVRDWLTKYLKPVYDFLHDVRDKLLGIYRSFIRPILDVIDVARGVLHVLGDLGIEWAQQLDQKLGQIESTINQNFLWLVGQVNRVINVIDSVVTGSLLFQVAPFLLTIQRDVRSVTRLLGAARSRTISATGRKYLNKLEDVQTPEELNTELVAWWKGEPSAADDSMDALGQTVDDIWGGVTS